MQKFDHLPTDRLAPLAAEANESPSQTPHLATDLYEPPRWGEIVLAHSFGLLLSPRLLRVSVPAVLAIDCADCRQVHANRATWEVRCCDVLPPFPNFLIGEILHVRAHPVLADWIAQRRGDPYGLLVPPVEAARYIAARQDGKYGLACPFLRPEGGRCSLYAQRPPICIGYHCNYPDVFGREMWSCLASTLLLWQDAASRYLVFDAGFDLSQMAQIWGAFESDADLWLGCSQRPEVYAALWQDRLGDEADFYRHCYRRLLDDHATLRQKIRTWHNALLLERLASQGELDAARECALMQEAKETCANDDNFVAMMPSLPLRQRYQQGAVKPEDNALSLLEQQRILLWYLESIRPVGLWQRLRQWFAP